MHLLRTDARSMDDTAQAVDLEQTPAPLVFLSFTDADLGSLASAWEADPQLPALRLASLAQLKHPYSVDLYVEKVIEHAQFVLVRLLGGMDYWRYGVEELGAIARNKGIKLAFVPGDYQEDARLDAASTLPQDQLRILWAYFQEGGPQNMAACLAFMAGGALAEPEKIAAFDIYAPACFHHAQNSLSLKERDGVRAFHDSTPLILSFCPFILRQAQDEGGEGTLTKNVPLKKSCSKALIIFYRSLYLADDLAPINALAKALHVRDFVVSAVLVTSLKDPAAAEPLAAHIDTFKPDVIFNTTAFSGKLANGTTVLDRANAPVVQVILSGSAQEVWQENTRGLTAADQAMNVVLPEVDGRIVSRAISFKAPAPRHEALEFNRLTHQPEGSRIAFVADLGAAWARLRHITPKDKRLACILSDYPAKGGRTGYAVGLDTPKSVESIAQHLRAADYDIGTLNAATLIKALSEDAPKPSLRLSDYSAAFALLPEAFRESVTATWGEPTTDFAFSYVQSGKLTIAIQPDRGRKTDRKTDYHDTNLPPCHAYIAFYLWLRGQMDAMIHCGTHGTLEWLPGKSIALSEACAPEVVLGPVPVIYPFIVNNPGEVAQAKRRLSAVTLGHMTPPLMNAGTHGALAEIEALFDEYAQAETLDPKRAKRLAGLIVQRAEETGLFTESGIAKSAATQDVLADLDAWLCDIKEMRIGDGLHIYGAAAGELDGLLRAMGGRFVPPGPAGAPATRPDVLPTGRNLFTIDPRAIPTRTAWELGCAMADEVLATYAQEHGNWPKRILLDLWGSASMRTGGDDLAQAFALIGVRPTWDNGSTRVNGFEILPLAKLGRARVDVTLRISGLFRDVFPNQIALFDDAVRAVASLDEPEEDNPLITAHGPRIFGSAPGTYGLGLSRQIAGGDWHSRDELGAAYLAGSSHAFGKDEGKSDDFAQRVASADAFVHVQDMAGQDILDSDAFAAHEGGFAAAAASLGKTPSVYHADSTGKSPKVRTLAQEVARVLRGRATNPRWIKGQMRHGHRGAAEIAESLDNLFAYAALTDAVRHEHFDLMFDATLGADEVRAFLHEANPQAEKAMAAKFDEALARGLWESRRNSTRARLDDILGAGHG